MAKKAVEPVEGEEVLVVTVLPPEVEEKVNAEISTALSEFNWTDAFIKQLEDEYAPMTIAGQEDKEGYLNLQTARKVVKNVRVAISKRFKVGREEAQLIVKKWIAKEGEVVEKLKSIEDPLYAKEKEWEAERDRLKQERLARIEQQGIARMSDLIRFGASLQGSNWILGDISYEAQLVKEADPEIYEGIRAEFEAFYNEKEAVRVENERVQKESEEKLRQQQQEFQKQQEDFRQQQEQFQKQQEKAKKDRIGRRQDDLLIIGMIYNPVNLAFEGYGVSYTADKFAADIDLDGDAWEGVLQELAPRIAEGKEKAREQKEEGDRKKEEKRQQELKDAADQSTGISRLKALRELEGSHEGTALEVGRLTEEEWAPIFLKAKFANDQKLERERIQRESEQKERERLENEKKLQEAGDKAKYADTLKYLLATPIHEMRSSQYRTKMKGIRDFIDGLKS